MSNQKYDLIILGSGCAGLTAGIYAGRARLHTLILESGKFGGQAATTHEIGNYPGVPDIEGSKLMEKMLEQAKSFGTQFIQANVQSVDLSGEIKKIITDNGTFEAYAVIIATGATPRKLGFDGEEKFRGRGVGYCATCDGFFFQDKDIFVIGGGNSAAEEALFLTKFGKKVTILVRKDAFRCEKSIESKVMSHPKIEVRFNTELIRAFGENSLKGAELKNNKTGEVTTYNVSEEDGIFGIFIFVGYEPASKLFSGQVDLDEAGYVNTNEKLQCSIPGVYAAGDIRLKELRQLVTATSDGAIAAVQAEKYILEYKDKNGIKDTTPPVAQQHETTTKGSSSLISDDLFSQVKQVFSKLQNECVLIMMKDEHPKSNELENFLSELCKCSDYVKLKVYQKDECPVSFERGPAFAICGKDENDSGVKFSGIPAGHEFNSLILGIYNFAGPGQALDDTIKQRISQINKLIKLQICISLSCHFCPDVVISAQRIAILNTNVSAEMIDIALFPEFRSKYNIMSVPALIINEKDILFGAQTMEQIITAIEKV